MTDDLDRSFYVYLHRDKATGTPFYVGKGKGDRANQEQGRSSEWQAKVDSLPMGYSVEIVQRDFTEVEAWNLEWSLVHQYGKSSDGTGTLVNVFDGGEAGLSVSMASTLPEPIARAWEEDYESRSYRVPSAEEEMQLLAALEKRIKDIAHRWYASKGELDGELTDLRMSLDQVLDDVTDATRHRRRRALAWKDFAYALDEGLEDLDSTLEEANQDSPSLIAIAVELRQVLREKLARLRQA